MHPLRIRWTLALFCGVVLATLSVQSRACSPAPISLYEQYGRHAKVFVGTIRVEPASAGAIEVYVDEPFKGFPKEGKWDRRVPVLFDIGTMCGFKKPKKGDRFLVFMNDGEKVSHTSGSWLIWKESNQGDAHLNPVLDELILLRQMLSPPVLAVVPDEETAIHLAVKAMIPVFGKEAVAKNKPFKAVFVGEKPTYEERVWHVDGTLPCKDQAISCRGGVLRAKINRVSGGIVRVSSGD